MTDMTFYHFFYFPSLNDFLYEKFVRLNGISEKQLERLKNKYRELLIKAALNTKKKRIVVKNPLNTGKIKLLLDMFPDAKFIHIYRNPVVTYLSTNKFYKSLLPATYLQDYKEDDITDKIIGNYRKLMKDYFETKHLIPEKNLYEIKFEEFEQDNMQCMKEIYERFDLDSWEEARPMFQQYMLSQKQYKKNKYKISQEELEKLKKEWGFAMQKLNYEVPSNLQIE
jgi:hypothetical protein